MKSSVKPSTPIDPTGSSEEKLLINHRKASRQTLQPSEPTFLLPTSEELEVAAGSIAVLESDHHQQQCSSLPANFFNWTGFTGGTRFGVSETSHSRLLFDSEADGVHLPDPANFTMEFEFRSTASRAEELLFTWANFRRYTRFIHRNILMPENIK